jgi:hypothetical protein
MKPNTNPTTQAKALERKASIKNQKIENTGLTSRIKGHVVARGKRAQARRDSR